MTKLQAHVRSSDAIRADLGAMRDSLCLSWQSFAKYLEKEYDVKIPGGSLCTFVKDGYLAPKYKHYFNLPIEAPAPMCPIHGIVERYDCRTQTVKAKNKPPVKRKRYPKYNNWLSDLPQKDVMRMMDERQEA